MGALRLFQKHLRIMGYSNTISCFCYNITCSTGFKNIDRSTNQCFVRAHGALIPTFSVFQKVMVPLPSRSPGYAFSSLPSLQWMAHGCWSSRGARPWSGCHVSVNSGDHFQRLAWVCPRLPNSLGQIKPSMLCQHLGVHVNVQLLPTKINQECHAGGISNIKNHTLSY